MFSMCAFTFVLFCFVRSRYFLFFSRSRMNFCLFKVYELIYLHSYIASTSKMVLYLFVLGSAQNELKIFDFEMSRRQVGVLPGIFEIVINKMRHLKCMPPSISYHTKETDAISLSYECMIVSMAFTQFISVNRLWALLTLNVDRNAQPSRQKVQENVNECMQSGC